MTSTTRTHNRRRHLLAILIAGAGVCVPFEGSRANSPEGAHQIRGPVPDWVFPVPAPPTGNPTDAGNIPAHVPLSTETFTRAQLTNLFATPDWFPQSHPVMPESVASGRPPNVYACGFCHLPTGQGRPENASLAGLPAAYIVQQVADFKSGARHSAAQGSYKPLDLMVQVATFATDEEVKSAAEYFSRQHLKPRVKVLERSRVPSSHVIGWVYAAIPGGQEEPLGERLLEFTPDPARHENRDDKMQYIAYVPIGSLKRGRAIATTGANGTTTACISCHGPRLEGVGLTPRLAGRSPSYLLRQLLAFQTGARAGMAGQPMAPVVASLQMGNMIDVAAYAASLPP